MTDTSRVPLQRQPPEHSSDPLGQSLRFFTFRGIDVGANWSVMVVVWLLGVGLAGDVLPDQYPGYNDAEYIAASMAIVVAFYAGLIGHELAHAVVALRVGVQVDSITVWLLGGIAKLANDPRIARDETRIAVAGPAASLVIAAGCAAGASFVAALSGSSLVVGSLLWLAGINLVLALFNLLPAFPLDGGRILRAELWHRTGQHVQATRLAAAVGRVFVVGFVVGGAFFALSGQFGNAVWTWLLGWFLAGAGRAEVAVAERSHAFAGRTVGEVMSAGPTTLRSSMPLDMAIDEVVLANRYTAYPTVDDDGRLDGLLTLDSIRRVQRSKRSAADVKQAAFDPTQFAVAAPEISSIEALDLMSRFAPNRLVVVDDADRPVGILTVTDVVRELELDRLTQSETSAAP